MKRTRLRPLAGLLETCHSLCKQRPSAAIAVVSLLLIGCNSKPAPSAAATKSTPQATTTQYPPRPTTPPPPFRVFHTTDNSITFVTSDNATDEQIAAILWQLHDAARTRTFAQLHIPQQLVDKRDPILWFHLYRGAKCADEKYTTGKLPCGDSYHAAGDYTLGSFANKDRDSAVLLEANGQEVQLWNANASPGSTARATN